MFYDPGAFQAPLSKRRGFGFDAGFVAELGETILENKMAAAKRPPLPVILLVNDLLDGEVLFAAKSGKGDRGWTRDVREASVAQDDAAAQALEDFGAKQVALQKVVDPYLVDVTLGADGAPVPRHYREVLRTLGPSNRRDLGKQADLKP